MGLGFLGATQSLILQVLGVAAFGMEVFALVDAARHRPDAFVAAGKKTKQLWLIILGVAALIGFVFLLNPLGILSILAVVAAGIYLADVRPALRDVSSGRGGGPYGGW